MKGDYPRFKATYAHEELVEYFLLSPAEQASVNTCRGDANRHGVAVLLKAVQYLGYFPDNPHQVPLAVRTFIAHQLQLLWDHTAEYPWHSRSRDNHAALIRQHTGWRFPTGQDKQELETWLRTQGAPEALTQFNRDVPRNPHVHLYKPTAHEDRRLFSVARLKAQPEPPSLGHVQRLVQQRHGMLDLLDIFVEADRLNGFTQFFNHSGTKEVRSREALRPLLLLDLFAEGTNTGIKRVAKANQHYAYDELLYVRKHYLSVEALRQANAAVVNKILAIRNPLLWGEGYACASDGKGFESWSQNLMTEWRSRYRGYGVLVYWHVEYGRQGIFATNSREHQAITTLCLQLLQNCMMLINTILVQQADEQHQFLEQLSAEDRRALTPLFYEHVNPYGLFALHLERPPLLEAA